MSENVWIRVECFSHSIADPAFVDLQETKQCLVALIEYLKVQDDEATMLLWFFADWEANVRWLKDHP